VETKNETYVLALDLGTSSVKSSIVSDRGRIVDTASYEYASSQSCGNRVEQNPDAWWAGSVSVIRELLKRNAGMGNRIEAIGASGHMLGCLPVDKRGAWLRPAMIHSDSRAGLEAERVADVIDRDLLYKYTGNILGAQSSLCKVLWLLRNEPSIYKKTERFLQSKDYLVSKLTGNIDTSDFSDASHAQFINIHTKKYFEDLFKELSLDAGKFPLLRKSADIAGVLSDEAGRATGLPGGIPVIAGGGDGACANLGAGLASGSENSYCCLGTTAWIAHSSKTPVIDPKSRLFDIVALDGESYAVYGTVQSAGKSVEWACDLFGLANGREFDMVASAVEPGSGGLIFLPYIEGERSPVFDSKARGLFFYVSSAHGKDHFVRSVLEGVCYALKNVFDVFLESVNIPELRAVGGGAGSGLWKGVLADALGRRLWTIDTPPGADTSLGAALAAFVGVGVFKNIDEAAALVSLSEKTEPCPENRETYERQYKKYLRLYPSIKELY